MHKTDGYYTYTNWKPKTEEKPKYHKCIQKKGYLCPLRNPNYNKHMCDDCTDYFKEEKPMYKPTSRLTLKNIVQKIEETDCDEARAKFYKYTYEMHEKGYKSPMDNSNPIDDSCPSYMSLTKTKKRRNWLTKYGFIEEDVKLKPCPSCGNNTDFAVDTDRILSGVPEASSYYRVLCRYPHRHCGFTSGLHETREKAIKAWNTRK
jgi:hypothetical protein